MSQKKSESEKTTSYLCMLESRNSDIKEERKYPRNLSKLLVSLRFRMEHRTTFIVASTFSRRHVRYPPTVVRNSISYPLAERRFETSMLRLRLPPKLSPSPLPFATYRMRSFRFGRSVRTEDRIAF